MMKIHVRAPAGTRLEQTERVVDNVERAVRKIIPRDEIDSISDNIGVPPFAFLLAFYQNDSVGPQDADGRSRSIHNTIRRLAIANKFASRWRANIRTLTSISRPPTSLVKSSALACRRRLTCRFLETALMTTIMLRAGSNPRWLPFRALLTCVSSRYSIIRRFG